MKKTKWKGWTVTWGKAMDRTRPRVKKTDRRFSGREHFAYYLDLPKSGDFNIHDVRAWCWKEWGPSKELRDWLDCNYGMKTNLFRIYSQEELSAECQNPHWCWINDDHRRRIMLATKEEASWFNLNFGL